MALSPSIPTSFVPKQPVSTGRHQYSNNGSNLFLLISLLIFGLAIIAAVGTFFYSQYLIAVQKKDDAALVAAEAAADPSTVAQFVRLRNRFTASDQILNQHVNLSNFLVQLGTLTLANVSFGGLEVSVADDRSAKISLHGIAKSLNSLAAESTVFANQPLIQSAIFSSISPSKDGISFAINATLDPSLVTGNAVGGVAPLRTGTIMPTESASPTSGSTSVLKTATTTKP